MNLKTENSGGDVNYYRAKITHPKRGEPYEAECEDIIAKLNLNFQEGEAFKAIWRKGAQRTLGIGKAGNTELRDAEKMAHYGARELSRVRALEPVVHMDPGAGDEMTAYCLADISDPKPFFTGWFNVPRKKVDTDIFLKGFIHWNPADKLPPVGCALLVRFGTYQVKVERIAHVATRDEPLRYKCLEPFAYGGLEFPVGSHISGKLEWTYP